MRKSKNIMIHLTSWIKFRLTKLTNRGLLSGLLLSSLIFVPTVAVAKYSPRRREPPKEYSRAGGSRGCPSEGKTTSTVLLAPHTFVGETASERPTLAWFASKPEKTDVHVYEYENNKIGRTVAVINKNKSQTTRGINNLKLPEDKALKPGKQYLWQVSTQCSDGSYLIKRAQFRVVAEPQKLEAQLSNVQDSSQRANIYAQNDLWYEALEEARKGSPQGQLGKADSELLQNLISVYEEELQKEKVPAKKQNIQEKISHLKAVLAQNINVRN